MKLFYIAPAIITLMFAGMSEYAAGTFSTIRDYVVTNPASETRGAITRSEIRIVGRWGSAAYDIHYDYSVGEKQFTGTQIDYSAKTSSYSKMIAKYPQGKEVTVFYDPEKPQYATLEKASLGAGLYGQLVALGFCYLIFAWLEVAFVKYGKGKYGKGKHGKHSKQNQL